MTEASPLEPRGQPRWSLFGVSLLHAAVLGWAAVVLPWRAFTAFAVLTAACAAVHLATAVLAALRHRWLARVWRAQGVASLAYLAYISWGLLSSAWYVRATYGGLGAGLAAALVAAMTPLVLLTVPIACWALAGTGGVRLGKRGRAAMLAIPLAAGGRLGWLGHEAAGEELVHDASAVEAELAGVVLDGLPTANPRGSIADASAASCRVMPSAAALTLLVTHERREGSGRAICLQAPTPAELRALLVAELERDAARAPVKLDLVVGTAPLPGDDQPIAALAVRPGLDGVCAADADAVRCLAPWQLVARDAFGATAPLAAVPDARFGIGIADARRFLGKAQGPLFRAATRGWVLWPGTGLAAAGRQPSTEVAVDAATLARAESLASAYILASQQRDGRFAYVVDPFSGREVSADFSIARQAGTTLALCELGESSVPIRAAIRRSLELLAALERPAAGDHSIMVWPKQSRAAEERLGPTALAAVAFLRCRAVAGDRHDALAGRLLRALVAMQRPDGGFHHRVAMPAGEPIAGPGSIYVDGQIVLALVLGEQLAADEEGALPTRATLADAAGRAMDWFGGPFWRGFVGDFVFLEENWHCIAAAAALASHRHDGYERFCLDYVRFKRRFVLDEGSGVAQDARGGYGFGNVVPPHNTATAGFGEALAAAITVARTRGVDTAADEALMRDVLGFLLRAQWTPASCWACSRRIQIAGGFSEHAASPKIRIDYVQHAWAAIGHGAEAIGMRASHGPPESHGSEE